MTPVKLTELERLQIRNSETIRNVIVGKIMTQIAYLLGVPNGDTAWAKNRSLAAQIKRNPSMLFSDGGLMILIEFNLLGRSFDYKDSDTVGELEDQVHAFLNSNSRYDYLIADYFDSKTADFII